MGELMRNAALARPLPEDRQDSEATSVTSVPTSIPTITVRVLNTSEVVGRPAPIALRSAFRPGARANPAASPRSDATRPTTRVSPSH